MIGQFVNDVSQIKRIEHTHAEVNGKLQARLAAGRLNAVRLLKEQNTEAVKSRILERETVLCFIHAEAARAAGASREEDVVVNDLLARQPLLL